MTSHAETFRFEDYRDDQSLREALLRLHPPGSSVEAARETLERAGGLCDTGTWGTQPKANVYMCKYFYLSGLIKVHLHVDVTSNHAGQVIDFGSIRQLTGL